MKSIVSSLFVFFYLLSPAFAVEERDAGFCQNAQTTADLMDCKGAQYRAELAHMAEMYQALTELADNRSDFAKALKDNQEDWLAYRDSVCELEGSVYKGGSLERVQQLDCLARVTAARTSHLTTMISSFDPTEIPVYATPPRWTNVLIHDYPEIFWAMGRAQAVDTDCDGVKEHVVQGYENSGSGRNFVNTIAIADSEQTGRPSITLQKFVQADECPANSVLSLISRDADTKICSFSLVTDNEACAPMNLEYDAVSKKYIFTKKDTAE